MQVRKINGDKLPTGIHAIKFSTHETIANDEQKTKGPFFKSNSSKFHPNGTASTISVSTTKENNFYEQPREITLKQKVPQHQINIGGILAHPNHIMVPNKGVTLIMNNGAVKKSYGQLSNGNNNQNIKYVNGTAATNPHKRMSRAQYAATIAVSNNQ